ncbi:MAG: glycine--tRNA ligase subunit beta, partial [Candidatus Firestonebacteria bacterium]|nr:glycine--tRNA ligase subunit beta [Candidatus Firestonebacteria bacterium]
MVSDLILEIGTEEIPARFIQEALFQLKNNTNKIFEREVLIFNDLNIFGTPRRLVLYVKELDEFQGSRKKIIQGPAKKVAFCGDKLSKAGEGFIRNNGIKEEDIQIKTTERGEYIYAVKEEPPDKTLSVLKKILPEIIFSIDLPRTMRWDSNIRFVRPIRWCLALFGNTIVEFNIGDIVSNNITYGHRLLKPIYQQIAVTTDYFSKIKKLHVIIDPEKRKKLILTKIKKLAKSLDAVPIIPDKLLYEVINLVEFPDVILGDFSPEFLEIPKEVLIETMTSHQKYFPIQNRDGSLLNKFLIVTNNNKNKDIIKEGNEKVLKARLFDARFFYYEDIKTPLIQKTTHLEKVIFQESLGTLAQKSIRMERLSSFISGKLNLYDIIDSVNRCVKLSKVDLITEMVKEFPELEGTMGSIYAVKSGESEDVAKGIYEHYLPRFTGDILPQTNIGAIVSIADKLDTITGCFVAGLIPSGSEDPYALRRQGIGIIEIMISKEMSISLDDLVISSLGLFPEFELSKTSNDYNDKNKFTDITLKIIDFLLQRLRFILQEKGIKFDTLDAVLNVPIIIPVEIIKK